MQITKQNKKALPHHLEGRGKYTGGPGCLHDVHRASLNIGDYAYLLKDGGKWGLFIPYAASPSLMLIQPVLFTSI